MFQNMMYVTDINSHKFIPAQKMITAKRILIAYISLESSAKIDLLRAIKLDIEN